MSFIPKLPAIILGLALAAVAGAQTEETEQADPGKKEIGQIRTELILGTDGDVTGLGEGVAPLTSAEQKRLAQSKNIPEYKHFVRLGSDTQPILKGYKNWAAPMAGSQAIMLTFQPQGLIGKDKMRMDLELWQNKKMVLRTDPVLDAKRQVYILGPKWRGGNLIITVKLVSPFGNR